MVEANVALQSSYCLSNGLHMPALGLGTFGLRDVNVIEAAICKAGVRHIDTAPIYGNQHQIGNAIEAAIAKGAVTRAELFLTTKLWDNQY